MIERAVDRLPPWGPVRAAVSLAGLSIPFVAWSLLIPPDPAKVAQGTGGVPIPWVPLTVVEGVLLAMVVVVLSAVLAGWIGGLAWRIRPWLGVTIALWAAWALAITLLPLVAGLLGLPLFTPVTCFEGCTAELRSDEPFRGIVVWAQWLIGVVLIPWAPFLALAGLWSSIRQGWFELTVLAVVALHAICNWFSIIVAGPAGFIPYACLATGIVVWARWIRRGDARATLEAVSRSGPSGTASGRSARTGRRSRRRPRPPTP